MHLDQNRTLDEMKIVLKTLPKGKTHRCGYETAGDWWFTKRGKLKVTVSDLGNAYAESAILIHELVEAILCEKHGITEQQVSDFDRMFERERAEGKHSEMAEPGFDLRAPYLKEHQAATLVEMLVVTLIGSESWPEHEGRIE